MPKAPDGPRPGGGSHPRPGSVSVFRVGPDGALAGLADRREHPGRGPVQLRQDCAHAVAMPDVSYVEVEAT